MDENQIETESEELSKLIDNLDETLTLGPPSTSLTHENDDDEEFEFSFVGASLGSPVSAAEVFKDGKIRIVSPINDEGPSYAPPVNKVFVVSDSSENDDAAEGSYFTAKSPVPEMSQKSNSTGFSKLRKMRDLLGRSNSDGKDAFVFLTGKNDETASFRRKKNKEEEVRVETAAYGGERKEKKKKSAYEELYGGGKDKKKSYLPYRQDLVGFFTSGTAFSRNVHPY